MGCDSPPGRSEFSRPLPTQASALELKSRHFHGRRGFVFSFFICFYSNMTCALCLGAGWGAAPKLAPCHGKQQHLLAWKKIPTHGDT